MATSQTVTQNGNTTQTWIFSGGGITNHEAVVTELETTGDPNTGLLISNIVGFIDPTRYEFDVTVKGPSAVAFRINSNGV
ncbi:MAG TPA: hypothetical protein VF018_14030 [Acidobacteriaceae bacterium]